MRGGGSGDGVCGMGGVALDSSSDEDFVLRDCFALDSIVPSVPCWYRNMLVGVCGPCWHSAPVPSPRCVAQAADRAYYLYQTLAQARAELGGVRHGETGPASEEMGGAARALEGIVRTERAAPGASASADSSAPRPDAVPAGAGAIYQAAMASLADDLSTPSVVASLAAPLKTLNDLLNTRAGRRRRDRVGTIAQLCRDVQATLALLGLPAQEPEAVVSEMRRLALQR